MIYSWLLVIKLSWNLQLRGSFRLIGKSSRLGIISLNITSLSCKRLAIRSSGGKINTTSQRHTRVARVMSNESGKVIGSLNECARARNENGHSGLGRSANAVDFARPVCANRARLSFINETPTLMTKSGGHEIANFVHEKNTHGHIRAWARARSRAARPAEKFGRKQDSFRSLSENLPVVSQYGTFHVIGRISWRARATCALPRASWQVCGRAARSSGYLIEIRLTDGSTDGSMIVDIEQVNRSEIGNYALIQDCIKSAWRVFFLHHAYGLYNSFYRLRYCIQWPAYRLVKQKLVYSIYTGFRETAYYSNGRITLANYLIIFAQFYLRA